MRNPCRIPLLSGEIIQGSIRFDAKMVQQLWELHDMKVNAKWLSHIKQMTYCKNKFNEQSRTK